MKTFIHRQLPINTLGIALILFGIALFPARSETRTALSFDGIDDVVEMNPPPVLGSTFTEEAWILPESKDDKFHGLVGAGTTKLEGRSPGLWYKKTSLHAGFSNGTKWSSLNSRFGVITLNEWNHVAVTFDGKTLRLFANGTEVGAQAFNYVPARIPVREIGQGAEFPFVGAIRELRLWDRALSPEEIRGQISRQLTGAESGLVACFRFDEGSGVQPKDSVPDGPKATFTGGPRWINSSAPVSPALLKTIQLERQAPGVETYSPIGDNNAPDVPIEITLRQSAGNVDLNSIQLTLDQSIVDAIVTTNQAGALVIRDERSKPLEPGSTHTVKLSYLIAGSATQVNNLSYDFSVCATISLSK